MILGTEPSAVVVDPPLNPNQPRNRMNRPSAAIDMLWPGITRVFPLTYFPRRGPTTIAPANAKAATRSGGHTSNLILVREQDERRGLGELSVPCCRYSLRSGY